MAQSNKTYSTSDELHVVEQLLDHADYDAALEKVNAWLESHPDDGDALSLKATLCLETEREPEFIANTVTRLAANLEKAALAAELQKRVESLIEDKLAEGKRHVKTWSPELSDAMNCFDFAIALAPDNPAIALAAAISLLPDDDDDAPTFESENTLQWLLNPPKRKQMRTPQRKAVERYLEYAIEHSANTEPVFHTAAHWLALHHLSQDQTDAALSLLASLPSASTFDDLRTETAAQIVLPALRWGMYLLAANQTQIAASILDRCAEAWPTLAAIPFLRAEASRCDGNLERAITDYQKSIACPISSGLATNFEAAYAAWKLANRAHMSCIKCGADMSPPAARCRLCGTALGQSASIAERFKDDKFSDKSLARIGLAEAWAAYGQIPDALKALDDLLDSIPNAQRTNKTLAKLRAEWHSQVQPVSKRINPAGKAWTAWTEEGLTPSTLALIHAAFDSTPEDWSEIDLAGRLSLARALVKGEFYQPARQMLNSAFSDAPDDSAIQRLDREQMRLARRRIDKLMNQARVAVADNHPDDALTILDDVFTLHPDDAPAYALRGQIRLQEGNLLPALEDFRRVLSTATSKELLIEARIGAATALEQYLDFDGALAMLDTVPRRQSTKLRTRIERKQRGEPAILVECDSQVVMHDTLRSVPTTQHYNGFFAIAIRAIGQPQVDGQDNWRERVYAAAFEFIQVLGDLRNVEGDPIFAIRFISRPHPAIPERGQLTVALVARVSAQDKRQCKDLALDLWHMVADMLPSVQEYIYVYEPITDTDELKALLKPFPIDHVAEIARRHEISRQTEKHYAVYPFTPGSADLHNLCWFLLRQKAPAALSINLLPTEPMEWERTALNWWTPSAEKPAVEATGDASIATAISDPIAFWSHETIRLGQAQANRHTLNTFHGHTYVVRISIALAAGVNPLLPESIAAAMLGPVRQVGEALYGGYEVVHTNGSDEFAIALRNFQQLDVQSWGFSLAPENACRLRHLFGEHETAILFRFPLPGRDGVPGVPGIDARPIPPPVGMPARGTILGESVTRLNGVPMRITQSTADRRRHTYIVGKTGVGKTTLIQRMALQDIEAGHGLCLVDPHGDLVNDVLARIPPHRKEDVILFDPSDEERPIGLNLLEATTDAEKHRIVTEFIGLLFRMYDPHQMGIVGPRFEHNVRNAMLTVMSVEGNTLIEVVRALTDIHYVKTLLPHVTDPLVRNYWERQIANTSDFHKSEILDYIVSKFSRFVGNRLVRNIVGQRHTTLNFREIMDKRKILLVNLSKGKIGAESAQFLGLLLMQRLLISALSRANVSADRRPDFFLYVDEFQNFATELFGTILSEGRKYGVATVIANQYLTQLDKDIRDAIFGNVGTIVGFRVGTQDASALMPELYPVFGVDDLVNLPRYTACVKLLVDGMTTRPFTMRTIPDTRPANPEFAHGIREASRQTYGRDVSTITDEVQVRFAD